MFFDGSHKAAKKGKPKRGPRGKAGGGAKSADLIKQQAQEDRERRKREKLQRNSARTVQAAVRSYLAREAARQAVRAEWDARCAEGDAAAETLPASFIASFLFFYTPRKDASRALAVCRLIGELGEGGGLLAQLAARSPPELRQYELLLRRLVCALLPRPGPELAAAEEAQKAELLLTLTDWERWCKAGFSKEHATAICWGMLSALTAAGMLESAAAMLRSVGAGEPPHPPLLISVVGLSLRPVLLGMPAAAELDECRVRFCSSVACVPNLAEAVPSAMAAVFRLQRLWATLLPVLAACSSAGKLPVPAAHAPALLSNLIDLAAPAVDGANVELVGALFTVLSWGLPHVFSGRAHAQSNLFDAEADDEEEDEPTGEPEAGMAGGDAKRFRAGGGHDEAVQARLEALLKPAIIGPVMKACFADTGSGTTSAALHVCFAVEWILRASPSRLSPDGPRRGVLNLIAFQNKSLLPQMWECLKQNDGLAELQAGLLAGATAPELQLGRSALILFCESYSHLLTTLGDDEFFVKQIPFALDEVIRMTTVLRDFASSLYLSKDVEEKLAASTSPQDVAATRHLLGSITNLLRRIVTRDSRRRFCDPGHWVAPGARVDNDAMVTAVVDVHDSNHTQWQRFCRQMPFSVPFESRVRIFHERVRRDRNEHQGAGPDGAGGWVRVRRDHLFEDALDQLGAIGDGIKAKLRVQFIDVHGMEEAGIDGGGVFKEFMHEIVRASFGPAYALFKSTPDHLLYPNPSSEILGPHHLQHFRFLGLLLGKALYEGVLIELPLAGFFLSKILGQFNFVDDLPSLDEELYRNLMFLKAYEGDCEELGLNFAIVNNDFDESRVTELMHNGKDIAVTNENRMHYIHRVANYRLNFQIKRQSAAFLDGLREIIPVEWFQMFSEGELQQLISGTRGGVDIDNLRAYTNYSGGYNPQHPVIELFWHVLGTLSREQQSALLQFATSSDRAPLLGFQYLNPPFCIHRSGADTTRLPTASTCMNLLKLPPFETEELMREKIITAIDHATTGFDLS